MFFAAMKIEILSVSPTGSLMSNMQLVSMLLPDENFTFA